MNEFEKIEQYILGKMSEVERRDFEALMESDESLKKEVEIYHSLISGIKVRGFKKKLEGYTIPDSEDGAIREQKIFSIKRLSIAASIVGLLVAGWFVFNKNSPPSKDLMAEVFFKDAGLPTVMGESKQYTFYDAMVDYRYGKVEKAFSKWSQNTSDISKDTLNYYMAMASIEMDALYRADSLLLTITPSSELYEKAKWYRVKILLLKGRSDEALKLLETVKDNKEFDISGALDIINSYRKK